MVKKMVLILDLARFIIGHGQVAEIPVLSFFVNCLWSFQVKPQSSLWSCPPDGMNTMFFSPNV